MSNQNYYIPHGTYWPIIGSIGISTTFVGLANLMHDVSWGAPVMGLGFTILTFMLFGCLELQSMKALVAPITSKQTDRFVGA